MINFVGIGDLVLDVYQNSSGNLIGYYAGGSVWNDLLNLSKLCPESQYFAIATRGIDWAGDFVQHVLSESGINTENILRLNKQTKRFSVIVDSENTKSQLECPNCKETIWYSESKLPIEMPHYFSSVSKGVVIIDNLKKSELELTKSFCRYGWNAVLDIGHINHLRYMNADKIKVLLCGIFVIIQMTNRVFAFLKKRFSCADEIALFEILGCRYLNITDGENGSRFVYRDDYGIIRIKVCEAVSTQVIDPTGAGDAYFSKLLQYLDSSGKLITDIDMILKEAGIYASNRVSVIGAQGKYNKIAIPNSTCNVCGSQSSEKTKRKIPSQRIMINTDKLLFRTLNALESCAPEKMKKILDSVNGQILTVGTGGSYTAAKFAAKCITEFHSYANAQACYPRDILIRGIKKIDAVFLFSYSGKTKDIQRVYELCKKNDIRVYIVTKYECENGRLLYDREDIISYNFSKLTKERGFISMAGTLIPMCIFGEIYYSERNGEFRTFLNECFVRRCREYSIGNSFSNLPKKMITVDIFSGIDTICAATDLESKFIESGLGRVVIHEKKDFSHGRFNIIEKYSPDLIIFLENAKGKYSDKLYDYLIKREGISICRISSEKGVVWGDLDLVIASEFLSKSLSTVLGYDMAKPDYPDDSMALYRYSSKDIR